MRGLIDRETAIIKVYKGFIELYFLYCAPVRDGIGVTLNDRLQSTYDISSRDLLDELQWNSLSINRNKQKAIFMFQTLNGLTSQYLEEMFSSRIGHYTHVKISQLVASLQTSRQQVVFARLVTSCQQVWNKLLTTCNNLVDIIRLLTRLFQQYCYNHDITILLQPCYIMTVSDLLEQPCNKSDNVIKLVTSC